MLDIGIILLIKEKVIGLRLGLPHSSVPILIALPADDNPLEG